MADTEQPISWYPRDRTYRMLAYSHANVALDSDNNLHYGASYFLEFLATERSMEDREITEISAWNVYDACVLDAAGIVSCYVPSGPVEPQPFQNPPYQRLRGNYDNTCAQRVDHTIECSDGRSFSFGALRDYAVSGNYRLPPEEDDLELCVLTQAGSIECVGARYPESTRQILPTGDPVLQ